MTLEETGRAVAKAQQARPGLFLAAALLVTLALAPGIVLLVSNVEPSIEKVLPEEVGVVRTMNAMRSQYGADMMYLVMEAEGPVTDMRSPAVLDYQALLAAKLREHEHVLAARSAADLVLEARGSVPDDEEAVRAVLRADPRAAIFLDDAARTSIVQLRTDTGADAAVIGDVVAAIEADLASLEASNPGVRTSITGFNAIDRATFSIIISDFARITGLSFLGILVILAAFNRGDLRKVGLSLSVIMLALVWTFGLTGYLGITITVVTMVAGAMIMALGIDYGVHLVHRYADLLRTQPKERAHERTLEELLRAFLGSSLTTTAGFLALLFGTLPAMRDLGIVLAIGITLTLAASMLITPVLMLRTEVRP